MTEEIEVDADGEVEFEVEFAENGIGEAPAPDTVTLAKSEFEELRTKSDSTAALMKSFSSFAESLKTSNQNVNVPTQEKGETDEEFMERIEALSIKKGGFGRALNEWAARFVAPVVAQRDEVIGDLNRRLAGNDPTYKGVVEKYGGEVQELLGTLNPNQRGTENAMKWATDTVRLRHLDEEVAARVQAQLAEAGGEKKSGAVFERGGVSSGVAVKKVFVDPRELAVAQRYMGAGYTKEELMTLPESTRARFALR